MRLVRLTESGEYKIAPYRTNPVEVYGDFEDIVKYKLSGRGSTGSFIVISDPKHPKKELITLKIKKKSYESPFSAKELYVSGLGTFVSTETSTYNDFATIIGKLEEIEHKKGKPFGYFGYKAEMKKIIKYYRFYSLDEITEYIDDLDDPSQITLEMILNGDVSINELIDIHLDQEQNRHIGKAALDRKRQQRRAR